jgi:protein disulfide-isomerase A1
MILILSLAVAVFSQSVVVLTNDNFESALSGKHALVEFYAPWCGHCKRLLPEFEKAAERVGNNALLGKVDCTVEKNLASKFTIQGYPTIYWFVNGVQKEEYDGNRSAEDIQNWINARIANPEL